MIDEFDKVRLLFLHKWMLCFSNANVTLYFLVRSGSVIADFTITFNDSNLELIEELNQSVSSTGHLYNMPLTLQELTPKNGKQDYLPLKVVYVQKLICHEQYDPG